MPNKFSVEQLLEYKKRKKRQSQLTAWGEDLEQEMQTLTRKRERQAKDLRALEASIAKEFSELEKTSSLFNWSGIPDQTLSLEDRKYVTQEKKEIIFNSLIEKFKTANPKAKTFPFKELHQMLEKDYQVETRSVTNFFKDILPKYELVGGTRTRSIVLKAGGNK